MTTTSTGTCFGARRALAETLGLVLLAAAQPPPCPADGRQIDIRRQAEGISLHWSGISDAPYEIQALSALPSGGWGPLGSVSGQDGDNAYFVSSAGSPSRFFRVLFPQPQLAAGEPAFAPEAGGTVYITGQFFYPGDQVRVGGLLLTDITFLSPTLIRGTLPPLAPGLYGIEVVSGSSGGVLATLPAAIEVAPSLETTLAEPPEWPPAGPAPSFKKEFKGHVTLLKAFDDEEPSTLAKHTKTGHVTLLKAFDDEEPAASARHTKTGHVTLLKAFDDEEPAAAARGRGGKTGHVTILKAFDDEGPSLSLSDPYLKRKLNVWLSSGQSSARGGKTGHVTLMKAFDDDSDLQAGRKEFKGHVTLLKAFDDEEAAAARGIEKKDIRRGMVLCATPHLRLHSGEVQIQACDLALAGRGIDFAWTRTYRSRTGTNTTQGASWSHAYDVSIQPLGGDILIHDGTGRCDTYRLQPDGTYACPGLFREGVFTNGAFRLTFADTGFWSFNPLDASPAAGKLARIEDRNGNAITLSYDTAGRLAQITDTLDRVHAVAYDGSGRVASVTDSTGRAVTYAYDTNGDLVSVTSPPITGTPNGNDFPDGKTVSYAYTSGQTDPRANHLLLTVTDGKGLTASTCAYDLNPASASYLRATAMSSGSGTPAVCTYVALTPSPDNRFAAMRCIVNDPAGNVTESFFDLRNRCVLQREFTGRATPGLPVTAADNRPTGKLRSADPDFYETQLSWNNDSLCTKLTLPSGLTGTFIHGGDANTTARMRKRPELLYQAWDAKATGGADTDGDGVPDLFKIETRYTYDPRFGSDTTIIKNMRDRSNELECRLKNLGLLARFDGDKTPVIRGSALGGLNGDPAGRDKPNKGWDGTIKGVKFDGGDDDCDSFATSVTDPRGTTTTAEYDAHGNCTRIATPYTSVADSSTTSAWDIAYDTYGQINAITSTPDAAGRRRVTSFGWQLGHLHEVVDDAAPDGLAITATFERDNRGNVTRAVDPDGHDALYTYNALDQLVCLSSPPMGDGAGQRVTTTFFYDANDNITRVDTDNRRENGASVADNPTWTTRLEYGAMDRCTAVITEVDAATAVTNRFEYDPNGQLAAHLSPLAVSGAEPSNRTDYAYDERGLLFRVTRAPGTADAATTEYAYTVDCNPATKKYVDDVAATYAYDGFGRAKSVSDAGGNTINGCFDGAGALTVCRAMGEVTDVPGSAGNRRLAETRWSYDSLGRCTARIDSFFDIFTELAIDDGARTTTFGYAPNGQLTGQTNDLGQGTSYSYDTAGRLAAVTQPGSTRYCTCTPGYMITRITSTDTPELGGPGQTYVTDFAYDALGRLTASWDSAGNTNRWHYDSLDRVVRTTDPRGNEQRGRYDGRDRMTDAIAYVGPCDADDGGVDRGITINTTHVEYDANGRVAAVTDSNTNTTTYAYDARDRITGVTNPDGTMRHLVWSPRSNLAQETDANGTTVAYSYDSMDRVIRKDVTCGAGVEPTTTFETFAYDGLSRLVAASNDHSASEFSHDSLGNLVQTVQDTLATSYTYDSLGNQRTCTCPSGYKVHRTFNPNNEVATVSVESGGTVSPVASFAYDGPGRLARVSRPNLTFSYILWNGLASAPNPAGDYGSHQVAAVSHTTSGGSVIDERVFAYDRAQNKILRAQTEPFTPADATTTNTWDYDALNRTRLAIKTKGTSAQRLAYVLDGKGNRIAVTNDAAPEFYARDATLPEPADFQMDQYTDTPYGAQSYDATGNLTSRVSTVEQWLYHCDYAGRLVQVDGPDAFGGVSPVAAFDYDALGRRVAKTTFPSGQPPDVTQFVYGEGDVDEDCDGSADDVIETRKGGAVSSVSVLGGGASAAAYAATGRMLAPPLAIISGAGELLFTHADDLGSVLALTDASGSVVERCDFDDFGAPTFLAADGTPLVDTMGMPASASPAGNPYLFRGMRWDGETGLYIDGTPKTPTYYDCKTGQYATPGTRHAWGLGGNTARTFANNSPWTLKKEEGGRHTPFHNRRELNTHFENGDIPTQEQFSSLIDSLISAGFGKSPELKGHVTLIK